MANRIITDEVVVVFPLKPCLSSPQIPLIINFSIINQKNVMIVIATQMKIGAAQECVSLQHHRSEVKNTLGLPTAPGCWSRYREQPAGLALGGNLLLPRTGQASLGKTHSCHRLYLTATSKFSSVLLVGRRMRLSTNADSESPNAKIPHS